MTIAATDLSVVAGVGLATDYGMGTVVSIDGLSSGAAASELPGPDRLDATAAMDGGHADPDMSLPPLRRRSLQAVNGEIVLALTVARMALSDAGIEVGHEVLPALGVVVSTQHAGMADYAEQLKAEMSDGDATVSPVRSPLTGFNGPAGSLGILLGAAGPNATLLNGGVGGIDALGYALDAIATDRADAMLVCGVDVIGPATHPGVVADPAKPFDRDRDGPAYGSCAAAVVIERAATCAARHGRPRAVVGSASSAYSPHADLAEAAERALGQTLRAAQTDPSEIAASFAGANGSVTGDAAEAEALHALLGTDTPVVAVKGGIGECMGADAVAQIVFAVLSLERRLLPPTPGFQVADETLRINVTRQLQPLSDGPVIVHAWDDDCAAGAAVLRPPTARQAGAG